MFNLRSIKIFNKKPLVFTLLFLLTAILCHSQESQPADNGITEQVFIIAGFEFDIKGRTRPDALIYNVEFKKGEVIQGKANLDKYIREKTQMLVNQRVLKDNAEISYTVGERDASGAYPVTLTIRTEDSWNLIALPYPKYSSNTGFELIIKARDYNFLGTMSPLRVDLGYQYDEKGRSYFNIMLDSGIPFRAFNLDWHFNFDNYFDYRPDMEQPYFYENITGISVELPLGPTTITTGFDESLIFNEENSDSRKRQYKDLFNADLGDFQDGLYMSSNPYISWKIPTGIAVGYYGDLVYTPNVSAVFNHEFSRWPLDETRKGPFVSFGHKLGFGRVDWIGNFLKGIDVRIGNSYDYNFFNARNDLQPWSSNISVAGKSHVTFDNIFGISARLMYRQWFFDHYSDSAGDVMRGILDKDVFADYMVSVNLDLSMNFFTFNPSNWFNNQKLQLFNFDFHIGPFLDAAVYRNPEIEAAYGNADFTKKTCLFPPVWKQ